MVGYDGVDGGDGYSGSSNRKCLSDFYQQFILEPSRITAPLTSMLKTSGSTESTTRPGKGGVGFGGDGGNDGGHWS